MKFVGKVSCSWVHVSFSSMSSPNTQHQYSMENIADMLWNIKCIILTWSLTSQMQNIHLQQSIWEILKFMLNHLQTNDEEIASDSRVDEDGSDSDRGTLTQDNGELESFYNFLKVHFPLQINKLLWETTLASSSDSWDRNSKDHSECAYPHVDHIPHEDRMKSHDHVAFSTLETQSCKRKREAYLIWWHFESDKIIILKFVQHK